MRVVYFGTGEFAIPALKAVSDHVVLAVSQPDRPTGRGLALRSSPLKVAAMELGIPVATPEKCRVPEFIEQVRSLNADALVVASYGQILSESLLHAAAHGGINLHGSILPSYRGAAPIQRAILDGRNETGVSLMQMDRGMDSGDVIEIVRTPISENETYGELQDRLAQIAAQLIAAWLPRIAAGGYPRAPQIHEEATFAPKIHREDAELHFDRPAWSEHCRVRAMNPSPGAFARLDTGLLKVHRTRMRELGGPPGTLIAADPFPVVAFGELSLEWAEVQPEGKKKMSGRDWIHGTRLRPGEKLTHG